MPEVPFPAIDFTSRDYASLRQSMIDGISTRLPEWTSRSPQDFGIVLIELFATMGDILSYYADRVANEAFLPTATQRSSVVRLAQMLNYRVQGNLAAFVELTFTVDPTYPTGTIPAGTVVRSRTADGSAPVVFTTDVDVVVPEGAASVNVSATQGQLVRQEQIGVSEGNQDQSFVLLQTPVVESTVVVQVRESPLPEEPAATWTFTANLLNARPGDSVYTTSLDVRGMLAVQFGDGVNGRIPPRSAVILATYRAGGGATGNVLPRVLTEMADPPNGVLAVTNELAARGGVEAESIESIRFNAPLALQALNRAVTVADFASLALQVPQVGKARAEAVVYTHVAVYVAPIGGGAPPQRLLNEVVTYLSDRKLIGVDVVAVSPTYVPIDITVTISVGDAYVATAVRSAVESALKSALAFDAVAFGQRVAVSDIYRAATHVAGVNYASLARLNRRGGVGVIDVILQPNEIPTAGVISVVTLGGMAGGDPTGFSSGTQSDMPAPSGAPTITHARCDPSAMHLEMSWRPGANTTAWYVEVQYRDHLGNVLTSSVWGPATDPSRFIIDVSKGTGGAVSVGILTQAFNNDLGPALSPITFIPNPCGT